MSIKEEEEETGRKRKRRRRTSGKWWHRAEGSRKEERERSGFIKVSVYQYSRGGGGVRLCPEV